MDTRTVETTVALEAGPERAIRAFLDAEDLAGWWGVTRSLVDARPGGAWSVAWDAYGDAATDHSWFGVLRELGEHRLVIGPLIQNEPERPLFGPLEIEIVAEAAGEGSRLTVLHHGYQHGEHWDWLHAAVVSGWRHVLAELQRWLAER